MKHYSQLACFREEKVKWSLFRKAQMKILSCFVTTASGLFEKHTQRHQRTWNTPLHPLIRDFGTGEGKCQTKNRQIISADHFPNLWTGLNPPWVPSTKKSQLACNFSRHCSPASLTPTASSATLCRNPSLQYYKELGEGPAGRLHSLLNTRQDSTDLVPPQGSFPSQQFCSFLHIPEKGRHFNSSCSRFARWAAGGNSQWAYTHI